MASTSQLTSGTSTFYLFPGTSLHFTTDGQNGYHVAQLSSVGTGVYEDVVNITGSGYIYGISDFNGTGTSSTVGIKVTVDGTVMYESPYESLAQYTGHFVLGYTDGTKAYIAWTPIRFTSSLRVQVKGSDTHVKGNVVYVSD